METQRLQHILVPVDSGGAARNALVTAVAMCRRQGAELHRLRVLESSTDRPDERKAEPKGAAWEEIVRTETERIQELAARSARQHQVRCSGVYSVIKTGHRPAHHHPTLDTPQADFFVGPFTGQIVYNARVPVLSIRPRSWASAPGRVEWQYGLPTQTDLESGDDATQ